MALHLRNHPWALAGLVIQAAGYIHYGTGKLQKGRAY